MAELGRRLSQVPRAGRVILYGESILEASEAYTLLRDRGWPNVTILEDAFSGWRKSGFPVEREP